MENAVVTRQPGPDDASVAAWVSEWGSEVARVDLAAGRRRFDPALVAFGTYADVVVGVDRVEAEQWSRIWPAIEDFAFEVDRMETVVSPDRLMAAVAVPWTSTGFSEDGTTYPRPGRATIVLRRADVAAPWVGVHTHFSLARGVPERTFGRRRAR